MTKTKPRTPTPSVNLAVRREREVFRNILRRTRKLPDTGIASFEQGFQSAITTIESQLKEHVRLNSKRKGGSGRK